MKTIYVANTLEAFYSVIKINVKVQSPLPF